MKKHILVAIAAIVSTFLPVRASAGAAPTQVGGAEAAARVEQAVVYLQGVELTHTATAHLSEGVNELRIEGLSPQINQSSLKIKTSDGVVVTASEFSVDHFAESRALAPAVQQLQTAVESKEKEAARVKLDMDVNKNMSTYLSDGIAKNVSGSESGLGMEELRRTIEYYKTKAIELETERATLVERKKRVDSELDALKAKLQQEQARITRTSGVLRLSLTSPRDVDARFVITYYTTRAQWTPYYDINVASTDDPVSIMARAKVSQSTSLDWNDVRLILSTSVPTSGKQAPQLDTWFLSPVQRVMTRAKGVQYDEAEILYSVSEESVAYAAAPLNVYEPRQATIADFVATSGNELNVSYDIDLPYSIPGNNKPQTIDLVAKEADATYKYVTVPKLDERVYLVAEIGDWQRLELLSGLANITYDGTYVGQTHLDAASTDDKLTLTLGTDARVAVKRELLQDFSTRRSLGSNVQQAFAYRITVKNNQTSAVRITVEDQYPVSKQKNVKVTPATATDNRTVDQETGRITWEDEIPAGASVTHDVTYTVEYPKGTTLNL